LRPELWYLDGTPDADPAVVAEPAVVVPVVEDVGLELLQPASAIVARAMTARARWEDRIDYLQVLSAEADRRLTDRSAANPECPTIRSERFSSAART
jgi:hypothetical protein